MWQLMIGESPFPLLIGIRDTWTDRDCMKKGLRLKSKAFWFVICIEIYYVRALLRVSRRLSADCLAAWAKSLPFEA